MAIGLGSRAEALEPNHPSLSYSKDRNPKEMAPNQQIAFDSKPVFSGIPVSGEWLAELVQRDCSDGLANLVEIKARRLDEDQGYCSIVAKLELKWSYNDDATSKRNALPSSVIIKMPTAVKLDEVFSDKMSDCLELVFKAHNNECLAYQLLKELTASSILKALKIPHIYGLSEIKGLNSASFLLMEDLSGSGRTADLIDGLTVEQCKRVIDNIATMHAYCIANPDWKTNINFHFIMQGQEDSFTKTVQTGLESLLELDPRFLDNILMTKEEIMDKVYNLQLAFAEYTENIGDRAVLMHGDLWINNMLFGVDAENTRKTTDELIALIDWQGVYPGCCTADISRMLICSMDWQLRRENEEMLLEYYYETLLGLFLEAELLLEPGGGMEETSMLPENVQPLHSMDEVKRLYFEKSFRMSALICPVLVSILLNQKQTKEKYNDKELRNFVKRAQAALEDTVKHMNLYN